MGRRKTTEKNIRKLTKTGGHSLGITFPIEMVRKLGWRERQKLTVELKGRTLIVRDWEK